MAFDDRSEARLKTGNITITKKTGKFTFYSAYDKKCESPLKQPTLSRAGEYKVVLHLFHNEKNYKIQTGLFALDNNSILSKTKWTSFTLRIFRLDKTATEHALNCQVFIFVHYLS